MAINYQELALELRSYWSTRKRALLTYWDFYYGDSQRYYLNRFEGEDETEYAVRVTGATVENHCAKTCDVLVSYLYGQPGSKSRVAVRIVDAEGEIIENLQRILVDNLYDFNEIDALRVDAALMSSVTGVCVVYKEFVDRRTGLPFDKTRTKKEDISKYGTIRLEVFDSVDTMAVPYTSSDGVIYPRKLGAVIRYYSTDNFSGNVVYDRLLAKRFNAEEILEVFDDNEFVRAKTSGGGGPVEILRRVPNPYKSISTPFTIFRNYGDPMYIEGQSDLIQMVSLQTTLNELMNDDKMTIDYHSFPILKLTGGAKLPSNFIRKVNSALEFDINQDATYLTWDNVLEASDKFKESIRKQMTLVSGVSQLSRGNAEDVGQVRSGAGLRTLFQADINTVALKVPYFRKAEKDLASSLLEMYAVETGLELPDFWVEVDFPEDFVGVDELLKAQVEQIKLNSGVTDPKDIVKADHPDLKSEDEIEDIIEASIEHKKKLSEKPEPPAGEAQNTSENEDSSEPQSSQEKSQEQQT